VFRYFCDRRKKKDLGWLSSKGGFYN
jgi:hypothetical protein